MWDFMKKPKPLKPVCQTRPTHEVIKQLEEYRLYALATMQKYYEKIVEQLGVTDPASLETLNTVINEYKEIENSIDEKMNSIQEQINSFISIYGKPITALELRYEYDEKTKNLHYYLAVKEE